MIGAAKKESIFSAGFAALRSILLLVGRMMIVLLRRLFPKTRAATP